MNSEPNSYFSQEAPQWIRDMFQELSDTLFPDEDTLNLKEMQQRLDEVEQPPTASETPPMDSLRSRSAPADMGD